MAVIADVVRIIPKKTRQTPFVPFKEFENLLTNLQNKIGGPEKEFAGAIGYSVNSIYEWRKEGKVPRRALYALRGFAQECQMKEEPKVIEKIVPVYKEKFSTLNKDDIATLIIAVARCNDLEFIPAVALIKKLQELS